MPKKKKQHGPKGAKVPKAMLEAKDPWFCKLCSTDEKWYVFGEKRHCNRCGCSKEFVYREAVPKDSKILAKGKGKGKGKGKDKGNSTTDGSAPNTNNKTDPEKRKLEAQIKEMQKRLDANSRRMSEWEDNGNEEEDDSEEEEGKEVDPGIDERIRGL